ncbi:MAG TPA: methyltransferase domain-containing protein [Polyangiaceae bacterium]|jgi:SAM-dependent methyltransferase|nr:methyltransferase domain-containing protein [Polyangiaceae bacterium]
MSDESDQDPVPPPHTEDASALSALVIDDGAGDSSPPRSKPPPKPRLPSARPEARQSPLPPRPSPLPPARRSSPVPPPLSGKAPESIKPMPMIKLGGDSPRSHAPASSMERWSSPPSQPSRVPPPVSPGSVSVRVRSSERPAEPEVPVEVLVEAPTHPDISIEVSEGTLSFDVTTDDEPEPETPRSIPAPPQEPTIVDDVVVPTTRSSPPARSQPPLPPSVRAAIDAAPEIDVDHATLVDSSAPHIEVEIHAEGAEELHDSDIGPGSDEEPLIVSEGETLPISVDLGPAESEDDPAALPRDESTTTSRKPPPPPKRKGVAPSTPSEFAVAQALQAPKFEPPTSKPRARPWWEELFTDDFGRGILPPNASQVRREVDFIEDSLAVAKGGVVMDLACGSGAHAVDLATRGYGVVGFDLSLPQLAVAGELAQERGQKINFLQGDMRDMSFTDVFDGIYCWNTSFGYFEEERNLDVAERVFNALRPGGRFLLDVINRDFVVEQQPSQVWFEGDACVCMDDMSVDFITSRLRVKRTMMLDDGRTKECAFSIRVYSLHELGKLLHDIGFRVTEASGHPAHPGVFFGATSPRVVILAQKP